MFISRSQAQTNAHLGSKDGAVVRALASTQFGAGSIPVRCQMRGWGFVGFHLVPRGFLLVLRFSSLHKTGTSKFQRHQDRGPARKPSKADVVSPLNVVAHYLVLIFLWREVPFTVRSSLFWTLPLRSSIESRENPSCSLDRIWSYKTLTSSLWTLQELPLSLR